MRKKGFALFISEIMMLSILGGCGQNNQVEQSVEHTTEIVQESVTTQEIQIEADKEEVSAENKEEGKVIGTFTEDAFEFVLKDTTIQLGGDMITYQKELGEADEYSAAKSCLGSGEDKSFTYGGVTIYTKPIDQMDKIYLIEFYGDEALPTGVAIGSSKDDVIAAYGEDYELEGTEYLYMMEEKTLGIDIQNDKVTFIEIFGE